jgi:putative spermidine/putrescine transport system ATP-binding protein
VQLVNVEREIIPAVDETNAPVAAPGEPPQVRLEGLRKEYQDALAVADVTLHVPKGAFVSLLGPSGCGKTTTLRMTAGLIRPTAGRIYIGGQDVTDLAPRQRGLAMVFQQFALFPHMTVAENVGFGLRMRKRPRKQRQEAIEDALTLVQMSDLSHRYPKHLSGGQQQRVSLARAIVVEPNVLLLDEPLSNLDAKLRQSMRDELVVLQRRLGMTSLYVTHDQEEAMVMSDLIAVMNEGRIVQVGTPRELYERPLSSFVADFIGRINLLRGTLVEEGSYEWLVDVVGAGLLRVSPRGQAPPVGSSLELSVRPERIQISPATGRDLDVGNCLHGTIEARSYVGAINRYRVRLRDSATVALVEVPIERRTEELADDAQVSLLIQPEDVNVFSSEGRST